MIRDWKKDGTFRKLKRPGKRIAEGKEKWYEMRLVLPH